MSAGNNTPRTPFGNPVVEWIDTRLPLFTMLSKEYGVFPTPKNFNYFWNFGAIAMFMLVTMIISGITLAMHYAANTGLAFDSVERIMRDVNFGWLIRYIHMNGGSFFFIAVYIHMFRGMYYGSYKAPRELLWIFGVLIFLLMMATAFMGYVLPWGQMSYWGATVITNFFTAFPVVGEPIQQALIGGFSVDNPTLNRFFSLHYLLPFVIVGVVFMHVWALHVTGSNNPTGIEPKGPQDTLPFHPYYTMKDGFGLVIFATIYAAFVFFMPNALGHPDNYIPANPLVTPAHIVPEWYFLPYYAILRAVTFDINIYLGVAGVLGLILLYQMLWKKEPAAWAKSLWLAITTLMVLLAIPGALIAFFNDVDSLKTIISNIPLKDIVLINSKLGGVIAMFGSIAVLFVLPWLDKHPVRSARYRPQYRIAFLAFVATVFALGKIGGMPADFPLFEVTKTRAFTTTHVAQILTFYYFAFFLIVLPFLSKREKALPMPNSINEAVLQCKNPSSGCGA